MKATRRRPSHRQRLVKRPSPAGHQNQSGATRPHPDRKRPRSLPRKKPHENRKNPRKRNKREKKRKRQNRKKRRRLAQKSARRQPKVQLHRHTQLRCRRQL